MDPPSRTCLGPLSSLHHADISRLGDRTSVRPGHSEAQWLDRAVRRRQEHRAVAWLRGVHGDLRGADRVREGLVLVGLSGDSQHRQEDRVRVALGGGLWGDHHQRLEGLWAVHVGVRLQVGLVPADHEVGYQRDHQHLEGLWVDHEEDPEEDRHREDL
mmetsp:Transcript_16932/g.28364  ORF Transcript_16932/g.28364 Transcript_16932/m.28364 type:complete len:158 (-) Transcript_16932:497-970(-)